MEKVLKFKTNIKCMGCVAKVTPELDEVAGDRQWEVDIDNPDKVLTVKSDSLEPEDVAAAVARAGFRAIPLENAA